MKKLFAMILALVMVFALAACGQPAAPVQTGGEPGDSASPPPDDAPAAVDTQTVAVGAVVVARDEIPTDEIYALVSAIFENTDTITSQHAKGAELDLEYASSMTSVPYHPGAAKYFAEKGFEVASVKEGEGVGEGKAVDLNFGTGGEQGTYYNYGGVLASYVSGNTDYSVTAVSSGGSQANMEDLDANDVQICFVQTDVMSYAYNGERLFEDAGAITGFSVVAALYKEQVQIVTNNADLASVADLAGKKVSIGTAGSGVYFNAIDVLEAYGMTESDISPVYQNFGDSAESLKDGKIDAAFIVAGAPTPAVTDLATAGPVYLISLDKEHADSLIASSPYYDEFTIPAGTY